MKSRRRFAVPDAALRGLLGLGLLGLGLLGLLGLLASCAAPGTLPAPPSPGTATVSASSGPGPSGAASSPAPAEVTLRQIAVDGRPFSYCASRALDSLGKRIRHVIIAVHGLERDPCALRKVAVDALGGEPADTVVVAPHFASASDAVPGGHLWSATGWPAGEASSFGISSYAAMDDLVSRLGDRRLTLVGFSGGGQFVNRYAAVSPTEVEHYVVVNPSSYLYFDAERAGWDAPALASCPAYNDFRYGLGNLPPYAVDHGGADAILARYPTRRITYLIGTADDDPGSASLDRSCAARAQGANREERALNYHRHLEVVFGPRMDLSQPIVTVPGVGHDASGMLSSRWGREALRAG